MSTGAAARCRPTPGPRSVRGRLRIAIARVLAGMLVALPLGCGDATGPGREPCSVRRMVLCHELWVAMHPGHSASELTRLIETIPARFSYVSPDGRSASVTVLRTDMVVRAIRLLGTHPAVRTVERGSYAVPSGGVSSPPSQSSVPVVGAT